MAERRRVIIVADVGGWAHYHAGDEAILTSAVAWWRGCFPEAELVVLSEDPGFTEGEHGVKAIREPRVPDWFGAPWIRMLGAMPAVILGGLSGKIGVRFPDAVGVLQAMRGAWVLHVAGGGNLTSEYSELLVARSFVAQAARAFGVPVVVTGQQVGPSLGRHDEGMLRGWLGKAEVVGLRDADSMERCRGLGVREGRLVLTGDDALGLESGRVPVEVQGIRRPLIGLSLHHHGERSGRGETLSRLVEVLGPWLKTTGAGVVVIPHLRSEVARRSDVVMADEFLARAGVEGTVLRGECRDVEVKAATGTCDFVVTTRFHGAVFALSASVPVFMIGQDEYTRAKFRGLAAYFGLKGGVPMLNDGELPQRLEAQWRVRSDARGRLLAEAAGVKARYESAREGVRRRVASL